MDSVSILAHLQADGRKKKPLVVRLILLSSCLFHDSYFSY